ncbi:MAG: hypothetical protein ACD_56C00110G0016 [uncultured bacterium]|nr:MAG: hypothetical protein ACD_56C00110G0016 [uncultured bacterium]
MKVEKKIQKVRNERGFSLIEVLITLAILSLSLATITALMVSNIQATSEAKNQIIAMGLAQEGVELVRNFKDREKTFRSTSPVRADGSDYSVDTTTTFADFLDDAISDKRLYLKELPGLNTVGGFYTHSSSGTVPTRFYRKMAILNGSGQVTVGAIVSWNPAAGVGFPEGNDLNKCTVANKCISIISVMPDVE